MVNIKIYFISLSSENQACDWNIDGATSPSSRDIWRAGTELPSSKAMTSPYSGGDIKSDWSCTGQLPDVILHVNVIHAREKKGELPKGELP